MQKLYMLAAHEPVLDPRLDWTAKYASSRFDICIIGFTDERRPKPAFEKLDSGYSIIRLGRRKPRLVSSIRVLFDLIRIAFAKKAFPDTFPVLLSAALFLPLLFIAALPGMVIQTIRMGIRFGANLVRNSIPYLPLRLQKSAEEKWIPAIRDFRFRTRTWILHRINKRPSGFLGPFLYRVRCFISVLRYFFTTSVALIEKIETMEQAQIIHANDLETLIAGAILKKRTGANLVYDAHEYWPCSDIYSQRWEIKFWSYLEKILLNNVDFATTVSSDLAEELTNLYGKSFACVPNCEPTDAISEAPIRAANKPLKFLFQGTFAPDRGVEELISAWKQIDPARAVLLLRGPENIYKEECVRHAIKEGVFEKSVFFPPPVTEDQLVSAGSEADVGIIPYKPDWPAYRFCCPNKLSQYMRAGLAVLSNDLPYVKRILQQTGCGLHYRSSDLSSIVAAVNELCQDEGNLNNLKKSALKAQRENFNWQVQSKPLYEAYEHLSARH